MKSVFPLPGCLTGALVAGISNVRRAADCFKLSEFVFVSNPPLLPPLFASFGGRVCGLAELLSKWAPVKLKKVAWN
ncbi:MAG: hypothetical protein KUA37_17150 [Desulfomicrobium sp.]|nr:hypothetical protein [Pseudomonadota bacterium]MBV1713710.1 hypothetical protein [Desulfomicrobium sp.]MBU4572246.1 hypothetical protein [Pseudomonadota bacterium]MBU4594224.1 hypothetical protein [Pseudomonadota bacterium]MBV1721495.1 hypothetical protein [Desulfomicrobium sp.]